MTPIKHDLESIIESKKASLIDRIWVGFKNYCIDTSAKVGCYAPVMATMEAYNGLEGDQILQSRATASLIDAGVARVYGKALDYTRKRFRINPKKAGFKGWLVESGTMIGVYGPVYATILATAEADLKQIGHASLMGACIAIVTARPFGKYILNNWRKYWNYTK